VGQLVLIGILAKKVAKRPEWLKANVREICSVSDCVSSAPDGRIERWTHNDFGLYNTEQLAWETVAKTERDEYTLFAYRMFPARFDQTGAHPFDPGSDLKPSQPGLEELPDEGALSAYEKLGCDIVSRSSYFFECSPLSCNSKANEHAVNPFCLVDELQRAVDLGREFAATEPEPGPYFVIEVLRKIGPTRT
jgi:hypothetical protein